VWANIIDQIYKSQKTGETLVIDNSSGRKSRLQSINSLGALILLTKLFYWKTYTYFKRCLVYFLKYKLVGLYNNFKRLTFVKVFFCKSSLNFYWIRNFATNILFLVTPFALILDGYTNIKNFMTGLVMAIIIYT